MSVSVIHYNSGQYTDEPGRDTPSGFLYHIYGELGEHVGNIMGTVHVATEREVQLNGEMRKALETANAIYLESVTSMWPAVTIPTLTPAQINKLETFSNLNFPIVIKKLEALGKRSQILEMKARFEEFSPVNRYRLTRAAIQAFVKSHFIDGGIDALFIAIGKAINKPLLSLENMECKRLIKQKGIDKLFSDEEISKLSTTTLDELINRELNQSRNCITAWHKGSEEEILADHTPYDIIPERDTFMATTIHNALYSRKAGDLPLFAMGYAHLIHNGNNILKQLTSKGWTIQRDYRITT